MAQIISAKINAKGALLTVGSSGIGSAIARALGEEGAAKTTETPLERLTLVVVFITFYTLSIIC